MIIVLRKLIKKNKKGKVKNGRDKQRKRTDKIILSKT
jgi:hypothetical protein